MTVITAALLAYACFLVFFMLFGWLWKKRRNRQFLWIGFAQLAILITVILWGVGADDSAGILRVKDAEYHAAPYEPFGLTEEQMHVIDTYGDPAGFVVLYTGDSWQDRMETWYYPDASMTFEFYNGLRLSAYIDDSLSGVQGGPFSVAPDAFVYGVAPGAALSAAGITDFVLVPAEDALLENATLYFGEDMVLGFIDDRLCYAETLATER